MSEAPAQPPIDVERLVAELRERVARERAAGAYAEDFSGVELEVQRSERGPQPGLAARFDVGAPGPRIRFRPELGVSLKPVIAPAITLVKKVLLKLLFFVLDDLARQADSAVMRLEAALSAETAARERVQSELTGLAKRLEEVDARLARLERRGERDEPLEGGRR